MIGTHTGTVWTPAVDGVDDVGAVIGEDRSEGLAAALSPARGERARRVRPVRRS